MVYDKNGISGFENEYDGLGRLSLQKLKYTENNSLENKVLLDSAGKNSMVAEYFYKKAAPFLYEKILFKNQKNIVQNDYDSAGRLLISEKKGNDETESLKITYHGGNKIISHFKNGNFFDISGFASANFSYTNDGMLYFVQFLNSSGEKSESETLRFSEYVALYSPNSLLLREEFLDSKGNFTDSVRGYAYFIGRQDILGMKILEGAYFSKNGSLLKKINLRKH